MKKTISIDFDGVLNKPNHLAIHYIMKWIREGHRVFLWLQEAKNELLIRETMRKQGVSLDIFTDIGKIHANHYITKDGSLGWEDLDNIINN